MKRLLIMIPLLLLIGCGVENKVTKIIDTGYVISSVYTPSSFSSSSITTITTDKGIFILKGTYSVFKDDKTTMKIYDNGSKYLCFDSINRCYYVQ